MVILMKYIKEIFLKTNLKFIKAYKVYNKNSITQIFNSNEIQLCTL